MKYFIDDKSCNVTHCVINVQIHLDDQQSSEYQTHPTATTTTLDLLAGPGGG